MVSVFTRVFCVYPCFLFLQAVIGTTRARDMKTDFGSVVTLLFLVAVIPAGKRTLKFKAVVMQLRSSSFDTLPLYRPFTLHRLL